jgi:hypothetical protein
MINRLYFILGQISVYKIFPPTIMRQVTSRAFGYVFRNNGHTKMAVSGMILWFSRNHDHSKQHRTPL